MDTKTPPYILSIAPMMNYSDRFFRVFMRLLTKRTWLYTEMISTGAILHGSARRHLEFDKIEKPVSLQLGGSDEGDLARSVQIANSYGYDEINLNAGCPSERVQFGGFGACLMAHADKAARLVSAMKNSANIPITVKCRIGIDGRKIGLPLLEDYAHLREFVDKVRAAGASRVCVHARLAVLGEFSPKENREIPPLRCDSVYQLKSECPGAFIEINGGIQTLAQAQAHLQHVNAVMIGRTALANPFMFSQADALIDAAKECVQEEAADGAERQRRNEIALSFAQYLHRSMRALAPDNLQYAENMHARRGALQHLMHLYHGLRGARLWRQNLTEYLCSSPSSEDPQAAVARILRASFDPAD